MTTSLHFVISSLLPKLTMIRKTTLLSVLIFFCHFVSAQTNISGIVNSYYKVIDFIPAKACVRLSSVAGLGFNDKAMERTIVIHGAAYVDANRVKVGMYMGRSWGCPAVPQKESAQIINTIKNGTCLFIWHPSRNYLEHSKILNG